VIDTGIVVAQIRSVLDQVSVPCSSYSCSRLAPAEGMGVGTGAYDAGLYGPRRRNVRHEAALAARTRGRTGSKLWQQSCSSCRLWARIWSGF